MSYTKHELSNGTDLPLISDTKVSCIHLQPAQGNPFNVFGNSYFTIILFIPKSDIPYMPIIVH